MLKELGIKDNQRYLTKKSDINDNQLNQNKPKRLSSSYYLNKDNYRNKLIGNSESQRYILIKRPNMIPNSPLHSNPYTNYFANSGNKNLKNRKNLTDFWSLRYDKDKEDEQIYFLKKQNVSEIKNLIDDTLRRREKGKYKNHEKYVKKEAAKLMIKNEYLAKRDKIIKQHEKYEIEMDAINRKKKEKEFNNKCLEQRRNEESKEKSILEMQEKLRLRQQEWHSKNSEHLSKVENMYEQKHNSAVDEYLGILKKGLERHEKIEERKNEFNLKSQIVNQKRYIHLINYKNKTMEENNAMKKRLAIKHQNISDFYLKQKEIKNSIMETQRKIREEKIVSNIQKRIMNKNEELERKKRLLDLFEKHEENIEQCKMKKEKKHEQFILNNLLKSDEITGNYIRNNNMISYRNKLKMQKMKNKNIEVYNKILKRQYSARARIERYDGVRENKNAMLKQAKKILDEKREYKPEEIYRKVFNNEEMNIMRD